MADTLKEYLVGLGWKVNDEQLKKFNDAISRSAQVLESFGEKLEITVTAVSVGVDEMSRQLEDFYYVSQRSNTAVGNLQAMRYAFKQIGLGADDASAAVEALARSMRLNPGNEALVSMLTGKSTRDAQGKLRDTSKIYDELITSFSKMPFFQAAQYAGQLGIPEEVLLQSIQNHQRLAAATEDYNNRLKEAGVNTDQLSRQSVEYQNALKKLESELDIFGQLMLKDFIGPATAVVGELDQLLQLINNLDKETSGWSTTIITLTGALVGWKGALAALRAIAPGVFATAAPASVAGAPASAGGIAGAIGSIAAFTTRVLGPVGAFLYAYRPYSTDEGEQEYMKSHRNLYPEAPERKTATDP